MLTKLFEPVTIGSLELPNRIIMPALTTYYDHQRLARFMAARACGGRRPYHHRVPQQPLPRAQRVHRHEHQPG